MLSFNRILLVLLLVTQLPAYSQHAPPKCGTGKITSTKANKFSGGTVQNMVPSLKHDTCLNKKISIVFYIVVDSNYAWDNCPIVPCLTATDVPHSINMLNIAFNKMCVTFQNCSTKTIINYNFNQWTQGTTEPAVVNNFYTENTLNVYVVGAIYTPGGVVQGYSYPPGVGKDIIVISKNSLHYDSTELAHQVGHFLGLPDTYGEIGTPITPAPPTGVTTYEFVNRTNCYQHGDGFCDTEADPYPAVWSYNIPCTIVDFGTKDGNNEYYRPPNDNLMSEYRCRCQFTQEQRNHMAKILITSRAYLH